VIGKNYRIIAAFNGNKYNAASAFGYWYFKITR
jgi:hypothetical protein